jgi:hypothetical protein
MSDAGDRERLVVRGQKGDKGERGEQGTRGQAGLSRPVRRALVFLFALSVALAAFSLFWTAHEVGASQTARQQQGTAIEQKLCTTLAKLSALPPPGGTPVSNPSRAFEQQLHATLDELGPDIGCGRKGHTP